MKKNCVGINTRFLPLHTIMNRGMLATHILNRLICDLLPLLFYQPNFEHGFNANFLDCLINVLYAHIEWLEDRSYVV